LNEVFDPIASKQNPAILQDLGAFHLWRDSHLADSRVMFSIAMWMVTLGPIEVLPAHRSDERLG
jgi:hypothetical protein